MKPNILPHPRISCFTCRGHCSCLSASLLSPSCCLQDAGVTKLQGEWPQPSVKLHLSGPSLPRMSETTDSSQSSGLSSGSHSPGSMLLPPAAFISASTLVRSMCSCTIRCWCTALSCHLVQVRHRNCLHGWPRAPMVGPSRGMIAWRGLSCPPMHAWRSCETIPKHKMPPASGCLPEE